MSKKEATSTALTVQSTVPDALEAINRKIAALKHIQDSVYVTSGKISTSSGQKDIREEKSVSELVKAYSGILFRAKAIDEAYEDLGLSGARPVTKVDGSTPEEWKKDILLRIAIIEQKETLDELTGLRTEWEQLMDKEDKKAMLVKKMEKFANS